MSATDNWPEDYLVDLGGDPIPDDENEIVFVGSVGDPGCCLVTEAGLVLAWMSDEVDDEVGAWMADALNAARPMPGESE